MRRVIEVRTAWLWCAVWFVFDLVAGPISLHYEWITRADMARHLTEDVAVAWFLLGLCILASHKINFTKSPT